MSLRKMICITCPRGCHLTVDEETLAVQGNRCPKGEEYARNEVTDPRRVLTSTVRLVGSDGGCRLPVKTAAQIPKKLLMQAMREINTVTVTAPVKTGDLVIRDLLGTGIDLIACKDFH